MLKTILPTAEILKKHIECFILYSGESTSRFRYVAFPHYETGISFFKGANIQRHSFKIDITENKNAKCKIEILGKYTRPITIEYRGKLQEISIIFKPLGINRFFRENYLSIAPDFSQELTNKVWNKFVESLSCVESDMQNLECFLLSQYRDNNELSKLEDALTMISVLNNEKSISKISLELGYNLKTFQRHFIKNMGCTPIQYRRICRFRNSIDDKLRGIELKTLTDITYENGYFDQSYFIKEFKKLTNHNPKEFFKVANKIDGDKIIWEII